MSFGFWDEDGNTLEHELVADSDARNMVRSIGLDCGLDDIALTLVRGAIVRCDGVVS